MFFAPGLPVINTIKLCVMMYVRSWAVLTSNIPHETVFKVCSILFNMFPSLFTVSAVATHRMMGTKKVPASCLWCLKVMKCQAGELRVQHWTDL